jgi:hypothetical protein
MNLSELVSIMDEVFAFLAILLSIVKDTIRTHYPNKKWYVYGGYVRDLITYEHSKDLKNESLKKKLAEKISKTCKKDIDIAILDDPQSRNFDNRMNIFLQSLRTSISSLIWGTSFLSTNKTKRPNVSIMNLWRYDNGFQVVG